MVNTIPLGGEVSSRSIKVDSLGNTYVTGFFRGTADFDPGDGEVNLAGTGGDTGSDIFFAKYDSSGMYVFAKAIGGKAEESAHSIDVDPGGNIYIVGSFQGTTDFDPGPGTSFLSSTGRSDIFVAKYDPVGNYVFAISLGGPGEDYGSGIAVDNAGNVYVTGDFTGTTDFDPGAGTSNRTSKGESDIFVARYNMLGNFVYASSIGGTGTDYSRAIAVDDLGNAYFTGGFAGIVDFDPGSGMENLASNGLSDIFIARYDASGNYVYAKAIGGTMSDGGDAIEVDGSGNAYVTGRFRGIADFNPGTGVSPLTSAGDADIFVGRYDPSGSYVYAIGIGGSSEDYGLGIAVDRSGASYVTGSFSGATDFDPGVGIANLTGTEGEIFVAKYSISGDYLYARAMGGSNVEVGNSIAVDARGNAYIAGYFYGTTDFDPGPGLKEFSIGGTAGNGFIARLNNAGDYVWAGQLGKYPRDILYEHGRGIAVDALGNTYVTGRFSGAVDFDPGDGVANLTSAGDNDIFIAKYDGAGDYIYAGAIGSTGSDWVNGIAVDTAGNAYITGSFKGTVDFDPGPGIANLSSSGFDDIFIARYDPVGNLVYAKGVGGPGGDYGGAIAVDSSGTAFVTGSFAGTVDFDPSAGMTNLVSAGLSDIFVARYDGFGNLSYAKAMGGPGQDGGSGIVASNTGHTYITGTFAGTVDFDAGSGTTNLVSAGKNDIFLARYDASLNLMYARALEGSGDYHSGGIAVDGSGNAYLTGSFYETVDFDPGVGISNLTSAGQADIFIAKYNNAGNMLYARAMGGEDWDYGDDIAVDGSGNMYVTGSFSGTLDFDPGSGLSNLRSAGFSDIFIGNYDAAGNYIYAKAFGGPGSGEAGLAIAVDASRNVHITGYFSDGADFDGTGDSANAVLSVPNGEDIFIAKYGPLGSLPVELLSFTATAIRNGAAVKVTWSTASQTNNAFFEVERSRDGARFEPISRQPGCSNCTGIRQYEFTDNNPHSGLSYYRLKQVDHDAKFSYSSIVPISISANANASIQVYPNVTNGAFELRLQNILVKQQVVIRLLNASGSLIKQQTVLLNEGDNRFSYSLSDQASGVYYISVSDKGSDAPRTVKVIKK